MVQEPSLSATRILGEVCNERGVLKHVFADVSVALEQLVESLNRDAALHSAGELRTKLFIQNCLRQRLEIKAAHAQFPASFKREIKRPIFILGLPRSGTTLLHHLMNQDSYNRTPRLWELSYPLPPPEPATYTSNPRIAQTEHNLRTMVTAQPELRRAHLLDAEGPDECVAIFNRCLQSVHFVTSYCVPGYADWLWQQPLDDLYDWYRKELLLLQTNVLGEWVLKSPFHQWGVEALLTAFPDALLVHTHREPMEILASGASFCESLRKTYSDSVDPLACGRDWSAMLGRYAGHFSAWRDHAPAAQQGAVLDVSYRQLMASPLDTIAAIYKAAGRKLGLQSRMKMQAWLKAHPHNAHGEHRYDAARYGIDAASCERELPGYATRYREFL